MPSGRMPGPMVETLACRTVGLESRKRVCRASEFGIAGLGVATGSFVQG